MLRMIKAHASLNVHSCNRKVIPLGLLNFYLNGEIQLVNYLVASEKPVSLILHFEKEKLKFKYKIKDLN